jgi:Ca2+-binding RTX toxin-like protein
MQDFISAVQSGNRAEAWFQIRYNSFTADGAKNPGLPKRRYLESSMFSLYSDQTNMSADAILKESKDVYRMFTLHRAEIASYESRYGVALDGTRGSVITKNGSTPFELAVSEAAGLGIAQVDTLTQALNPARDALLTDLNTNSNSDIVKAFQTWVDAGNNPATFNSTDIYLDPNTGEARCYGLNTSKDYQGNVNTHDSILIGGANDDNNLIGGVGNDLLIGGNGNDYLEGGPGNDVMAGGAGNDTYVINGGGQDTIEDKQGTNHIVLNEQVLCSFTQIPGNLGNYVNDNGTLFGSFTPNGDFIVNDGHGNSVTLNQNFQSGDFGITLSDAPTDPVYANPITGDIVPADYSGTAGIQAAADTNGNPIGTAGAYEDILGGTTGNDHIQSGDLTDLVFGGAGDDWIEGGNGNDVLDGGTGNDLIEGDTGNDIIYGDDGNDQIFGESKIAVADAIALGNASNLNGSTGTGLKGDWLSGGAGDDTLVTGAGNDVLSGGGGNDLIIAGAGDDIIFGDGDYRAVYNMPGGTPRYSIGSSDYYSISPDTFNWQYAFTGDNLTFTSSVVGDPVPADAGRDVIYAGDGADYVLAGAGDDIVYGEDGNDTLDGEAGNDILLGGAGDDVLFGDGATANTGNDYLDGGEGNDTLWGGNGNDTLIVNLRDRPLLLSERSGRRDRSATPPAASLH